MCAKTVLAVGVFLATAAWVPAARASVTVYRDRQQSEAALQPFTTYTFEVEDGFPKAPAVFNTTADGTIAPDVWFILENRGPGGEQGLFGEEGTVEFVFTKEVRDIGMQLSGGFWLEPEGFRVDFTPPPYLRYDAIELQYTRGYHSEFAGVVSPEPITRIIIELPLDWEIGDVCIDDLIIGTVPRHDARLASHLRGYALVGGPFTRWVCNEKFPLCVQFTSLPPFAGLLGAIPVSSSSLLQATSLGESKAPLHTPRTVSNAVPRVLISIFDMPAGGLVAVQVHQTDMPLGP